MILLLSFFTNCFGSANTIRISLPRPVQEDAEHERKAKTVLRDLENIDIRKDAYFAFKAYQAELSKAQQRLYEQWKADGRFDRATPMVFGPLDGGKSPISQERLTLARAAHSELISSGYRGQYRETIDHLFQELAQMFPELTIT